MNKELEKKLDDLFAMNPQVSEGEAPSKGMTDEQTEKLARLLVEYASLELKEADFDSVLAKHLKSNLGTFCQYLFGLISSRCDEINESIENMQKYDFGPCSQHCDFTAIAVSAEKILMVNEICKYLMGMKEMSYRLANDEINEIRRTEVGE